MRIPFNIARAGKTRAITYIKNVLAQYFPNAFSFRPTAIDIYPTFRCNLKCIHCNYWRHKFQGGELPAGKWNEIIIDLRKWLGVFTLRICGGEPLVRRDIIDIIAFARGQGIFTVLSTNGTLISQDFAEAILQSKLNFISISLDSLRESVHDSLRGVPGSYLKVRRAIDLLKGKIEKIQIMTTIMDCNLDEILDLVNFCEDNKILISFQGLYGFDGNREKPSNTPINRLWPQNKKVEQVFDALLSRKSKSRSMVDAQGYLRMLKAYYLDFQNYTINMPYRCRAYERNFRIGDTGDVTFCHSSDSLGNVIAELPQKIWNSGKASQIRTRLKYCEMDCFFVRCYYYEGLAEMFAKFKNYFFT
ncbi:radical SAM protein [bacterium]|nr:radical SAM protein [bacterium]